MFELAKLWVDEKNEHKEETWLSESDDDYYYDGHCFGLFHESLQKIIVVQKNAQSFIYIKFQLT